VTALHRSMSHLPNGSPVSHPPMVHLRQDPRAVPAPAHRRPLSMLGMHADSADPRYPRSPGHHATPLPGTAYTPTYQQHAPYSPQLSNSPLWSPNSSIYLTPAANGSPSSGYASSVYTTPVGSSPCRSSNRYPVTPGSNSNSPSRYRPMSGYHLHPDRLQLRIEGQSSLV
jgi:hypothetical protein